MKYRPTKNNHLSHQIRKKYMKNKAKQQKYVSNRFYNVVMPVNYRKKTNKIYNDDIVKYTIPEYLADEWRIDWIKLQSWDCIIDDEEFDNDFIKRHDLYNYIIVEDTPLVTDINEFIDDSELKHMLSGYEIVDL
jgi:hypothetical protein